MPQRRYENFLDYSYTEKWFWTEPIVQVFENQDCKYCGKPVHAITQDDAHGPLFEHRFDSPKGELEIKWMCYECNHTWDHSISYKDKRVIPKLLELYSVKRPDIIKRLLVLSIWERIYYWIQKKRNKEVPLYVI